MDELDRRLAELGARWQAPVTPDVVDEVAARLAERPTPGRLRSGRRRLVLSLALVTVAAGALATIAPAREAILGFFNIGGETIRPVPTLPPARPGIERLDLGERLTLDEVEDRSRFPIRRPRSADLEPPDEVYRREPPPGGIVSFLWRARPGLPSAAETDAGLLMTQVTGTSIPGKGLDPTTIRETVVVHGSPGLWLAGGPHVLGYLDEHGAFRTETTRLAGNTLIWSRGDVTYRLEGEIPKQHALRIAESVR